MGIGIMGIPWNLRAYHWNGSRGLSWKWFKTVKPKSYSLIGSRIAYGLLIGTKICDLNDRKLRNGTNFALCRQIR